MTAADLQLFPEPDDGDRETDELGAQDTDSCAPERNLGASGEPAKVKIHRPLPAAEQAQRALASLTQPEPGVLPKLEDAELRTAVSLPLAAYYEQFIETCRQQQAEQHQLADTTLRDERNHVRSFGRWDADHPPDGWPHDIPWQGCPLGHLNATRLWQFFSAKVTAGEWVPATAKSRWNHLRVVLGFARKQGAIDRVPELSDFRKRMDKLRPGTDAGDEDDVVPYSDEELGRLYALLPDVIGSSAVLKARSQRKLSEKREAMLIEMRAALVLIANTGPRAADWSQFRFGRQIKLDAHPPVAVFTTAKVSKKTKVPLAEVTVKHLTTLRRSHSQLPGMDDFHWLFPHLATPANKDPLKSQAYRDSVKLLKEATAAIGLDADQFRCPWHAVRKSCTTRFNAHGLKIGVGQVGKLITHGQDADVASQSYDNPYPRIVKAVETIGWPDEFLA